MSHPLVTTKTRPSCYPKLPEEEAIQRRTKKSSRTDSEKLKIRLDLQDLTGQPASQPRHRPRKITTIPEQAIEDLVCARILTRWLATLWPLNYVIGDTVRATISKPSMESVSPSLSRSPRSGSYWYSSPEYNITRRLHDSMTPRTRSTHIYHRRGYRIVCVTYTDNPSIAT
ncbi:uncharacterized protein BDW43DRAFT_276317 [Aspergillus alliaceus]|uniref:uncharacterized protein n=1 Tax=Petromyces alliaceus TaxID=209559 RepID=UPI0012A66D61|nr:uncharacterized protein BDW43DRAFT_276317 [Aspergillus alliaceus]KAB8233444.1 hypothetical protein BDW43DRAFT_276317 [Aspergillus alliaceus]